MTTISIFTFPPGSAERFARRIDGYQPGALLWVDDGAVVEWPRTDDRPSAWQVPLLGRSNSLSGAFWGLFFGHLFLMPVSWNEPPSLEVAPDDALLALGLGAERLASVRGVITAGTSALFVVHADQHVTEVAEALGGGGSAALIHLSAVESRRLSVGFGDSGQKIAR